VGFKIAGSRLSGVFEIGTMQGGSKRVFAAVHRDTPRGLLIRLSGTHYDEWVVGLADPESVAGQLGLPTGQ
jgi:hypothetical protein